MRRLLIQKQQSPDSVREDVEEEDEDEESDEDERWKMSQSAIIRWFTFAWLWKAYAARCRGFQAVIAREINFWLWLSLLEKP